MPIYEYKCNQCNKTFDMLQSISAEPLKKCIYCQGAVTKLFSAPSFQFKGSGWYVNDYKGKKEKSVDKDEPSSTTEIKNAPNN